MGLTKTGRYLLGLAIDRTLSAREKEARSRENLIHHEAMKIETIFSWK